jgi:hypothetical protein
MRGHVAADQQQRQNGGSPTLARCGVGSPRLKLTTCLERGIKALVQPVPCRKPPRSSRGLCQREHWCPTSRGLLARYSTQEAVGRSWKASLIDAVRSTGSASCRYLISCGPGPEASIARTTPVWTTGTARHRCACAAQVAASWTHKLRMSSSTAVLAGISSFTRFAHTHMGDTNDSCRPLLSWDSVWMHMPGNVAPPDTAQTIWYTLPQAVSTLSSTTQRWALPTPAAPPLGYECMHAV